MMAPGLVDALAIYAVPLLILQGNWLIPIVLVLGAAAVNYVYFSKRAVPIRWLVPGLFFLIVLMIYPIFHTFWVALRNWSTGHILTKPQVVEIFEKQIFEPEEGERFGVVLYEAPGGDLLIRVERDDDTVYIGIPRLADDPTEMAIDLDATVVAGGFPRLLVTLVTRPGRRFVDGRRCPTR